MKICHFKPKLIDTLENQNNKRQEKESHCQSGRRREVLRLMVHRRLVGELTKNTLRTQTQNEYPKQNPYQNRPTTTSH